MAVKKVLEGTPDKVDDRYRVRLYNPNGGYYKKIVRGKRNAELHEAEMRVRLAGGLVAKAGERQVTVREYMQLMIESNANLAPGSVRTYNDHLNRHVYPRLGNLKVAKLGSAYLEITRVLNDVQKNAGPGSRRTVETLVRRMLRTAVRDGILQRNPLDGTRWPKLARSRGPVYAPEYRDVLRVREEMAKHHRFHGAEVMNVAILDVLAGTGVRIGEAIAIAEDDIDHERQTITILRQIARDLNNQPIFAKPKTDDSGPRTIPVPPFVLAALASTQLRNGLRDITLPHESGGTETHRLYFWSFQHPGKPASDNAFRTLLRNTGRRLELPGRLHPHCLRHRYTTELHNRGVPQRVIDYVTGHLPQGSVSLNTYTHVMQDGLDRVRDAVAAAWQEAHEPSKVRRSAS